MSDMTDDITELAKATLEHDRTATPGPWCGTGLLSGSDDFIVMVDDDPANVGNPTVAETDESERPGEDAAFIAHARTAAPDLARAWLAVMGALEEMGRPMFEGDLRGKLLRASDIRATIERRLKEEP